MPQYPAQAVSKWEEEGVAAKADTTSFENGIQFWEKLGVHLTKDCLHPK